MLRGETVEVRVNQTSQSLVVYAESLGLRAENVGSLKRVFSKERHGPIGKDSSIIRKIQMMVQEMGVEYNAGGQVRKW